LIAWIPRKIITSSPC